MLGPTIRQGEECKCKLYFYKHLDIQLTKTPSSVFLFLYVKLLLLPCYCFPFTSSHFWLRPQITMSPACLKVEARISSPPHSFYPSQPSNFSNWWALHCHLCTALIRYSCGLITCLQEKGDPEAQQKAHCSQRVLVFFTSPKTHNPWYLSFHRVSLDTSRSFDTSVFTEFREAERRWQERAHSEPQKSLTEGTIQCPPVCQH